MLSVDELLWLNMVLFFREVIAGPQRVRSAVEKLKNHKKSDDDSNGEKNILKTSSEEIKKTKKKQRRENGENK